MTLLDLARLGQTMRDRQRALDSAADDRLDLVDAVLRAEHDFDAAIKEVLDPQPNLFRPRPRTEDKPPWSE